MKRLKFSYQLKAEYSDSIRQHSFSFMFMPGNTARQRIEGLEVCVPDCEKYCETKDNFHNQKLYGIIEQPHSSFEIQILGTVQTGLDIYEEYTDNPFAYSLLKTQTPLTMPGNGLLEYHDSLHLENFAGPYDKTLGIMNALHRDICYDSGATGIHETAEAAFALGKGVCQDYAHMMLSLLRMEHIPARYVVGMIMGEGASHAWVEALCNGYWYGFDPTNRKLVNDEYIRVSCGRDSGDCSVIRGSFYGIVTQKQQELVRVEEIR